MKLFRRLLLALTLLMVFAILDAITLTQMTLSLAFGSGDRGWKIAVSKDQLGNAAIGGHEDETFSSRCWRMRYRPKYARIKDFIDWFFLFFAGEEDHCKKAYLKEKQSCKDRFKS